MTFKNGTFYRIESLQIVSDLSFEVITIERTLRTDRCFIVISIYASNDLAAVWFE